MYDRAVEKTFPDLPPLGALETFECAARHLSFTQAGRELSVTQSAVSHRIKDLEDHLGVRLFVRGRRLRLTDAGQRLFVSVHSAFTSVRDAVEDIVRGAQGRPIAIGCSPSFAVRCLVPGLESWRRVHPDIDVWLSVDETSGPPSARGLDGALRYGPGDARTKLFDERVFPVCDEETAVRLREPRDLLRETLLHDVAHEDDPGRVGWADWLKAAGVQVDPAVLRAGPRYSHCHFALDAAERGQGVALARSSLVRDDLAAGLLTQPFELELTSGLHYHWVSASRRSEIESFATWLVGRFGEW